MSLMNKGLILSVFTAGLLAACQAETIAPNLDAKPVIFPAQTVLTMTGENVTEQAVAVEAGMILAVGNTEDLTRQYPNGTVDESFAGKTIMPGLIDPHMHVLLGGMFYAQPFAPPWPMAMPDGMSPGYGNPESFHARLREIVSEAPEDQSIIIAYGFHNLVQGDLNRQILDDISPDRPMMVWHYSGHDFYFNSAGLDYVGATPALAEQFHGIDLDEDGELTGRIYEDAAKIALQGLAKDMFSPAAISRGLSTYFQIIRNAGITTTADLGYGVLGRANEDQTIGAFWNWDKDSFRLYLVPEHRAFSQEFGDEAANVIREMAEDKRPTPAPVLPRVKFFTDAAFYSQTMRLSDPGYLAGQSEGSKGLWVIQPGDEYETIRPYLEAGLGIHIHSNGDEAQTQTLRALTTARENGFDNDFVIEHGGLFSPDHVKKAGEQDAMVSAASHYVHYMGEAYADPLGPDRADWISPLGALSRSGSVVTLHSDAPLAPPQPLRAASVQITRTTREGGTYVIENALEPYDALEAITIDAARALGLSDTFGTIEAGKIADFTILDESPLITDPASWPDIGVWGVVLGGEKRPIKAE